MYWIYILKCENDIYYVGETSRLFKRYWEHNNEYGGLNTSIYKPINIVAIYQSKRMGKFLDYNMKVSDNDYTILGNIYFNNDNILKDFNSYDEDDNYDSKWVENNIVERMMIENENNWENIRGGKYVRFNVKYKYPKNEYIKDLPICNCGYPCDVKQNEKNDYLYFRCAKKNMWEDMRDTLEAYDEPCKFFMKYYKDDIFKKKYEERKREIKLLSERTLWFNELLNIENKRLCIGGCEKEYNSNNTIRYLHKSINLCFDCFINKYDELNKKYNKYEKCLI